MSRSSETDPNNGLDFIVAPVALRDGVVREVLDDGAVVLADEDRVVVRDKAPERSLLPLVDAQRTGRDLAAAVSAAGSTFDVVEALLRLRADGWIEVVRGPIRVTLEAIDDLGIESIRAALERGRDVELATSAADGAALTVLVARDYLHEELPGRIDAIDAPVLLARPGRTTVWLGPLLVPGETACWHCLAHRLRRHREGHALVERPPPAEEHLTAGTLAFLLREQVLEYRRDPAACPLRGQLHSIDVDTLTITCHAVTRRPQCEYCGEPTPAPQPVRLRSRSRVGDGESGFRSLEPEALLREYGHHVSPLTGIARGIWTVGDLGAAHVARAPHIPVHPADTWARFRIRGRGAAGGKGTTRLQARASALGEALERYSSGWHGTEPTETASYAELLGRGEPVLHPRGCMLFSDAQYARRKEINADGSFKRFVPEPFEAKRPIAWTRVWSLSQERWSWLPAAYAYSGAPQDPRFLVGDSNGNAAGSSIEDAVLQGFLELVERDSVALWWYNRLVRPGVDLAGVDDDYVEPLREQFEQIGREFWVLDLTADLEVPAFVCVSRSTGEGSDEVTMGFGAHVDARIGVLRAIAEMNQLMPSALREVGRRDRLPEELEAESSSFRLAVSETPYLTPDPEQPVRRLADFPSVETRDLGALAERCQQTVERAGMEMLVHDLTRPDVGLPVVKVIVPGMRHFWPRFAPGRLYEVPVALGWLADPKREDELNPVLLHG